MRENTKWIMLLTALAFVGLMVFEWGMDLSGRSNAAVAGGHLGSVNGEPITAEEYQTAYRNVYQQQQQQLGNEPITASMNREIEQAVWEQLVSGKLLSQELRRRGITVSDGEILQAARYAPPPEFMSSELFQTDGQFDLEKYQAFLQQPLDDQTLLQLEAYYRDVIPRSKLYFQNTAGAFVSDAQLWRMWQDANEKVQVRYLAWDPAALVPEREVQVSDAEIRAYYQDRRDTFTRPARATVKYLVMDATPGVQDSAAALQRARAALGRLQGGENFDAVAATLAEESDATPARTSITVVRGAGALPPAFEQAAFATPPGTVGEPLLTPYGYHVMRVESRSGDTAQVSQVLVPIELSVAAEDALLERADSIEAFAEDLPLEEVARRMQLPVQTVELAPPLAVLPGVSGADDGIDWAFREGRPGELSPLFEGSGEYYMLELVSRTEEGTLSLQEATPAIRPILVRRKQVEKARTLLADAAAAVRSGQSLEEVAARFNATVQEAGPFARADFVPGMGRMNAAIGAAFGLPTGAVSDLVEANGQLYLVHTVARVAADRTAWQRQVAEQRARVQTALADERWQQFLQGLRENAEIVDNRDQLRRQQASGQL